MNPPYGRVKLSPADRARFADVLYGHANLYGVFMAAGEQQLDAQGILAALVPTSFTAGRYFTPLRTRLTTSTRLHAVAFVEERSNVFTSVLQETCLAVFTRKRVRKTSLTSIAGTQISRIASVDTPTGSGVWLLPRRPHLAAIAASAATMPLTLATAGWRASTGPLVWNRRKGDLSTDTGTRIVWAADLDGGILHRDPARDKYRRIRMAAADEQTLVLAEPAVLVQRTTAPEQQRRLVAAELTESHLQEWGGAVVVENHVNVLRPRGGHPALSRRLLTRILATPTLDAVARCISGSVALSAYELESLPLPDANTLCAWESLDDDALTRAVALAYRTGITP